MQSKSMKFIYVALAFFGAFLTWQSFSTRSDVNELQRGHGKFGVNVLHSTTNIQGGHTNATSSNAGFMSTTDKSKLDGYEATAAVVRAKDVYSLALPANTYANGTSGVGATITLNSNAALPVADGGAIPSVNDVVLVRGEATQANLGLYSVTALGDGSTTPGVLTRSTFADTPTKLAGLTVVIASGGFGTVFVQPLAASSITIGTTGLPFFPQVAAESQVSILEDDFDTGGSYTAGAAAVPSTVNFGRLSWRSAPVGTGAAVTFVSTGQDASHKGVIELNTGTTTTGSSGMIRAASGPVTHTTLGANQKFRQAWWVQFPTLSDGTNTYSTEFGWGDVVTGSWTNGLGFKYASATSANWVCHAVAASSTTNGTGGTTTAVTSGVWHLAEIAWDGPSNTATCYIDRISIGSITTGIPTLAVSEVGYILKSAGTSARTIDIDRFIEREGWNSPR